MGYDTQFHFKRILEIKEAIDNSGNILPDFSFNKFHGSGVMTLYPYINLFPYVLLSFVIKSKIHLLYIIFFFNVLLTLIISFYSSESYIKLRKTSYLFSIIYSLSSIFLLYNLISSDFGIVSSYIFLPLIIFGFLNIINGSDNWLQLTIGVSLVLLSHILNAIIIIIFLLLFLLINAKELNKIIIINLFKSFILFVIMSSIFWLPFVHLYINNFGLLHMPYPIQLDRIPIKEFLSGIYGSKTASTIGFFPLISLFISPFFYKKFNIYIKRLYLSSLIIIIFLLFFPWKIVTSYGIFKILNQLQMTSRFLIIPLMNLSFILSLIISKFIKNKFIFLSTILFAILLQLITGQYIVIKNYSNYPSVGKYLPKNSSSLDASHFLNYHVNNTLEFNTLLNNYSGSDNDYILKNSWDVTSYVNRNLGFYNNEHKIKINHIGYNTFDFSGKKNINKLSLPIYVYNKEKLYIYLNDRPINNYANKYGMLTMNNIQNNIKSNNKVYVKVAPNPFRITGVILSIFGCLFALGLLIKRKFISK